MGEISSDSYYAPPSAEDTSAHFRVHALRSTIRWQRLDWSQKPKLNGLRGAAWPQPSGSDTTFESCVVQLSFYNKQDQVVSIVAFANRIAPPDPSVPHSIVPVTFGFRRRLRMAAPVPKACTMTSRGHRRAH